MNRLLSYILILIFFTLLSCNPKEVFAPLDTITIDNKSDDVLTLIIKPNKVKTKLTLGRGFHYDVNGIKYNMISKEMNIKFKQNESIFIIQVERHDEMETIDLIKNVIEEITITNSKNEIIFRINDIKKENIEVMEWGVNDWISHTINIR